MNPLQYFLAKRRKCRGSGEVFPLHDFHPDPDRPAKGRDDDGPKQVSGRVLTETVRVNIIAVAQTASTALIP